MSSILAGVEDIHARKALEIALTRLNSLEQRLSVLESGTTELNVVSINGNWGGIFAARPSTAGVPEGTLIAVDNGASFSYYILSRTNVSGAVDWQSTGWKVTF